VALPGYAVEVLALSHEATNWASKVRGISPMQKLVLMLMADCHNGHTRECFPSLDTLAEDACACRRTVIRAIHGLEAAGLISVKKQGGKSNRYILHTSATESPVSESHPCQKVTTPVTESHLRGVTESPEQERTGKNRKSQRKKFTDEHMAVAKEMADILQLTRKPNLERWANDVRLMVERDEKSCAQVMRLFRAANAHEFWSANILSPGKLRGKWDTLERQLQPRRRSESEDKWRYI